MLCAIATLRLSAKECKICDFFVYIPQYGDGTASLNVTVAASIVLHQFGVWAGFPERTRDGNKFIIEGDMHIVIDILSAVKKEKVMGQVVG
ncbi:hypothetical protein ABKV19_023114 [Rosa sericea]